MNKMKAIIKQFFLHGVGYRLFQSVKRIFQERYVQNSSYGKFQIILLFIQILIFAILIKQHLKDLLLCFQ